MKLEGGVEICLQYSWALGCSSDGSYASRQSQFFAKPFAGYVRQTVALFFLYLLV